MSGQTKGWDGKYASLKTFLLDKPAYHRLENASHVSISETGHVSFDEDSRVRYHIKLDREQNNWVYCHYIRTRNRYGCFTPDGQYSVCRVRPNYIPVSRYNRK